MHILEITRTSLTALWANKIRSSLTMLGVIIGVMSVILLISIGRGIQNYITDQFESLGSNLVFIIPGKAPFKTGRDPMEAFSRNKLTKKHIKLIKTNASDFIDQISGGVQVGATVRYKTKSYFASVNGMNADGFEMQSYKFKKGRPFTKKEVRSKTKVTVLGPKVADALFPNSNPIGLKIKVGNDSYQIIGLVESRGKSFDEQILSPITSVMSSFDLKNYSFIVLTIKNEAELNTAVKQIKRALLKDLKTDDFSVMTQNEILDSIQNILKMLTLALGAIAAISLIVGGIGIMNIMLVSVTERTREIGLRKALGATPFNITIQFLIESLALSIGGGLIGILLGWSSSLLLRGFLRTEVPLWAVLLAFSFSVFVGIVFGTYPAIQAGKKDPIESLRYE